MDDDLDDEEHVPLAAILLSDEVCGHGRVSARERRGEGRGREWNTTK